MIVKESRNSKENHQYELPSMVDDVAYFEIIINPLKIS